MIGKIKGTLVETDGREGLVQTQGGVSYWVQLMPDMRSLTLPVEAEIYTYLHVREDAHILYGFNEKEQYRMFQTLLTVDGVGPKTAHNILCYKTVAEIVQAVEAKEVSSFTSVSGLGKKTAQKIILELSSKLKAELEIGQIIETPIDTEALDALVALGYKVAEAREMLRHVDSALPTEQKVRRALLKK